MFSVFHHNMSTQCSFFKYWLLGLQNLTVCHCTVRLAGHCIRESLSMCGKTEPSTNVTDCLFMSIETKSTYHLPPHTKKVVSSIPTLSVGILHVLPVPTWVLSRYSSCLQYLINKFWHTLKNPLIGACFLRMPSYIFNALVVTFNTCLFTCWLTSHCMTPTVCGEQSVIQEKTWACQKLKWEPPRLHVGSENVCMPV